MNQDLQSSTSFHVNLLIGSNSGTPAASSTNIGSNLNQPQGARRRVKPIANGSAPGAEHRDYTVINSSSSHSLGKDENHSVLPVGNLSLSSPPSSSARKCIPTICTHNLVHYCYKYSQITRDTFGDNKALPAVCLKEPMLVLLKVVQKIHY